MGNRVAPPSVSYYLAACLSTMHVESCNVNAVTVVFFNPSCLTKPEWEVKKEPPLFTSLQLWKMCAYTEQDSSYHEKWLFSKEASSGKRVKETPALQFNHIVCICIISWVCGMLGTRELQRSSSSRTSLWGTSAVLGLMTDRSGQVVKCHSELREGLLHSPSCLCGLSRSIGLATVWNRMLVNRPLVCSSRTLCYVLTH